MIKNRQSFFLHLLLFVVVEVLFVVVLFHEFPETNIFTAIWIGHLTYWLLVIGAGVYREYAKYVWQRFLATYLPIVYHVAVHLWVLKVTLDTVGADIHEHEGNEAWIIIWTLAAGVLIFWGERLLHRKYHCDTHHIHAHEHCMEEGHEECEDKDGLN